MSNRKVTPDQERRLEVFAVRYSQYHGNLRKAALLAMFLRSEGIVVGVRRAQQIIQKFKFRKFRKVS